MQELTALLESATAAIKSRFMQLSIYGGTPIYRERVYCYELYHQLRARWPSTSPFTLNGEVDKRGHEVLRSLQASITVPDLLVHIPGDWSGNHAIIEIKHAGAHPGGILKDLTTLGMFRTRVEYDRAIYLFYGGLPIGVREIALSMLGLPPIELWLHETAGEPARFIETLRT